MDRNEYLSQLNDQQRDAVTYCDGPQLVIAGAGSGKTRVLTYKIVHLLASGHEPWRILALTFTNKAAREMRERIAALVGEPTARKLWMGTFHSIFARILRANADRIGFPSNFTIYDAADSKSLVKMIIKDLNLDDKIYKPSSVAAQISWAKNALISPEAYRDDRELRASDNRSKRYEMSRIYMLYAQRCKVAGAMDFDDLLYYTNVLLRDNPDVLRHYREYFSYILVDEYQDTNFAQHLIVNQLAQPAGLLCVVGDDAQSIYSFRGANISNILDLQKSYPTLATFKLERNYRSTQNIINAANSLIEKNKEQLPKKVYSENEKGAKIQVVQSYSDYEESYLVANKIAQVRISNDGSYNEFAVLYRTNAQSRILEESLRKRNIPYRIYGGLSFYQRREVKDAVAYFRLAINPRDDEALKRVINTPARGIGETTVAKLTHAAVAAAVSLWDVICEPQQYQVGLHSGTLRKLSDFKALLESFIDANLAQNNAFQMADDIIRRSGLMAALLSDKTPESVSKQENLQELLAGAKEFVEERVESGEGDLSLGAFLAEVSLATDQDNDNTEQSDMVTLMTMHAAKGLEFTNVFIVGAEEDLLPSLMSQDTPSQVEEERRLLYVAITRAKRFCMISYARSRFRNGQTTACKPSRFLMDIDVQYLNLTAGTQLPKSHNPIASYRSSLAAPRFTGMGTRKAEPRPAAASSAARGIHLAGELSVGMKIEHNKFGKGTITRIDEGNNDPRIVVDFEQTGEKVLLLRFAHFDIL